MALRIRNKDWEEDNGLKEDLSKYVRQNLKKEEILDFLKTKYPEYAWSSRTLSRRMQHWGISFVDYEVDIKDIETVVKKELEGTGSLLGYRAMHKKIREVHGLNVPRDVVYAVMAEVAPEGLEARGEVGQTKRPKRTCVFVSGGSDCTMSLDGHDKLCGYQKSMFPLCIYGGQDTYSGRINFLRVWTTNNKPEVIGRFYFDYLFEARVLPLTLRVDKGTETGVMTTMHCFLRAQHQDLDDPTDSVLHGPPTQNKIERFWRELLERMERFFKKQLSQLVEDGEYDFSDENDRNMLAFIFIPVVQKELDVFRVHLWNNHRARKQKAKELPTGIPEHIYNFPEKYGGEKCGLKVTEDQLKEVAELSNVLNDTDDYLELKFRQECERHVPNIDDVEPSETVNAYLYLKANFDPSRI